jgi:hypothetical protein
MSEGAAGTMARRKSSAYLDSQLQRTESRLTRRNRKSSTSIKESLRNGSIATNGSVATESVKPKRSQPAPQPGLRAMLYGLTMKMEREEANRRKQQKKMAVQEEKAMQAVPSVPIDATKFVAYVTERRKKRILFKGEYLMVLKSIDQQKCTTEIGSVMVDRNAYSSLPYDYNRVVLSTKPNDSDSHYINASYVQSWTREKAYVVTQAVKTKQQSAELWRMVWELGSNTIVMLTKIFDFMRVMCLQYWPQTKFQFGEIDVETLETKTYAHFVIRTFRLKRVEDAEGENARIVKHFHFTEWELNSFPYTSAFIELRRRVRQWTEQSPMDAPVVVHCRYSPSMYKLYYLSKCTNITAFFCERRSRPQEHINSKRERLWLSPAVCQL